MSKTYIHENTGPSRQERRHGYTNTGKHFIIPAEYRELATNTPYRKPDENDLPTVEASK